MGLDMYAWRVKSEDVINDFEVTRNDTGGAPLEELFYWRKHHDLHGWMERLYHEKGGEANSFNCEKVRLSMEDLARLEKDVLANKLPETSGFFFGNNTPNLDSIRRDMEFIEKARDAISKGDAVYYDSWW